MPKFNFSKLKFKGLFSKLFAVEYDVDITDDTAMLYRRNIVVKNIIFFSNIVYSIIFMILAFADKSTSNFAITLILFPLSFVVNKTLNKFVNGDEKDMVKQTIASYICVFYMFVVSIMLYVKMRVFTENALGGQPIYSDAAYVLIYYSIGVISLYQSPKLIKNIAPYVLAVVSCLHLSTTYDIVHASYTKSVLAFVKGFFVSDEFKDILVRTLLLAAYLVVMYSLADITSKQQLQRKVELIKRQTVQDDFTKIVTDMFNVTLNFNQITEEERLQGPLLEKMVVKLSDVIGLSEEETLKNKNFSTIHLNAAVDLDTSNITSNDEKFKKLREQTSIGNEIARRLELRRKAEDIYRSNNEGWSSEEFVAKTKQIQNNRDSNIILLSDLYIILRSPRNYKRTYSHENSMKLIREVYYIYFDNDLIDRFERFGKDFEELFNNYND